MSRCDRRLRAGAGELDHLRLRRGAVDDADIALRRALLRRRERRADRAARSGRDSFPHVEVTPNSAPL